MTPDATRRRAIGQILLLAAGLWCWSSISAGSVYLVNKARDDSALGRAHRRGRKPDHRSAACRCAAPKAPQRGYLLDTAARFLRRISRRPRRSSSAGADAAEQLIDDNPVQIENAGKLRAADRSAHSSEFRTTIELARTQRLDDAASDGARRYRRATPCNASTILRRQMRDRGRSAVCRCARPRPTAARRSRRR